MGLVAKKPGVCTTIQDMGRTGYLGSGFSPSGVMDRRAARIANLLVENDANDPVLEFALAGPTIRFTTNTIIALTGGDFNAKINGLSVARYKALIVRRGDILQLESPLSGVYGYLAIAGGSVNVPLVMGSTSTNIKCGLGGWHGAPLNSGDYLPFTTRDIDFLPNLGSHEIPVDPIYPKPGEPCFLRVVPGPQDSMFTEEGQNTFFGEEFSTTVKSDRMGFRLDGPQVQTINGSDIISDGIAFGAVQIPSHGRPIIMLADRQTTGGYAKIGTVASVDIPKLVQSPVGTPIRFTRITVQQAQDLYREEARYYEKLAKTVKRPCAGGVSPRRTARRLFPILKKQAKLSKADTNWIQSGSKE